jgi:myosin-18
LWKLHHYWLLLVFLSHFLKFSFSHFRVTPGKMFGFMKKSSVDKDKDREEKEKKKKEKKEKKDKKQRNSTTSEELARLEEAKKGLFWKNGNKGMDTSVTSVTESESSESLNSTGRGSTPDTSSNPTFTATAKVEISKTVKVPPRTQPKPQKPRGILKGKSNYGPDIPNQGVRGNLDDTITLEENTYTNEIMSGKELEEQRRESEIRKKSVKSMIREINQSSFDGGDACAMTGSITQRSFTASLGAMSAADGPPPLPETGPPADSEVAAQQLPQLEVALEPGEKSYEDVNLHLPDVAPPRCPKPREIHLKRQPAGDYGFILRRGTVLQRDSDDAETKKVVIFAEPGPKNQHTGLLPGDRLIEVDSTNVEDANREDIIELIRKSGAAVTLKVQPIPELSELSLRSGLEGEEVDVQQSGVSTGTLKRSGSMRYRNKQVSPRICLCLCPFYDLVALHVPA